MASEERQISLDDVFSDEEITGDSPEVVEETPEIEVSEETEDAAPPAEDEDEPEEVEKPKSEEPKSIPIQALMDEREKRQAAQKRAEELEGKLKALEEPAKSKTSVFEDENKFRDEFITEIQQTYLNDKLNMSQALAEREFGKDKVAEKLEEFQKLVADNPDLTKKVMDAPLPYHELVDIVNKHAEFKAMENVDDYKAKLRAEIKAELEKELSDKTSEKERKRNSVTPSLASTRSTGGTESNDSLLTVGDVFES